MELSHLLKEFIETALSAEMEGHLDETVQEKGNKRNGKGQKTLKTMAGDIIIETPQDRHSSFSPEIVKKRETVLIDNLATKSLDYMALE